MQALEAETAYLSFKATAPGSCLPSKYSGEAPPLPLTSATIREGALPNGMKSGFSLISDIVFLFYERKS